MRPGPLQVIACPNCSAPAAYVTFASGNTFGAIIWTDGKCLAPMLRTPLLVVECGSCGECYWRTDARKVRQPRSRLVGRGEPDRTRALPPGLKEPSEEAYLRALAKGLAATPRRLRTLRTLAWWRGNDAARTRTNPSDATAPCRSEASRENLEALAGLLNERSQADRLVKAEIRRELGDFESALGLLRRVTMPRHASVVRQLRAMCEARDERVRPLQREH